MPLHRAIFPARPSIKPTRQSIDSMKRHKCRAPLAVHLALPRVALIFLTGCRGAPSINLVGSFFPAWMLCVGIGVFGVLILRRVFVRTQIEAHLGTLPLVYFCLWVLLTLGSWLLFFRG